MSITFIRLLFKFPVRLTSRQGLQQFILFSSSFGIGFYLNYLTLSPAIAQNRPNLPRFPSPRDNLPPTLPRPQLPPALPPNEELLPLPQPTPLEDPIPGSVPMQITVTRFDVVGSTVFSIQELAAITEPFTNRSLTISELYQVRTAINQLYQSQGYITSGAFIPPQELQAGVVKIQVIEGELEAINITGLRRLQPSYIRSRLALGSQKPLNVNKLLESLQLLQLNPLIKNIAADLSAGTRTGQNILEVKVQEADTFDVEISSDNGQVPSVGSVQLGAGFEQRNVTGFGDRLNFLYTNTQGSNRYNVSYSLPINPRNGTVSFTYETISSRIVESPFDELDIESEAGLYELSLRQPIMQTPSQEIALGFSFSYEESNTTVFNDPFPLSPVANENGETRISALRFFQEWFTRNEKEVLALRSQFSFGINALESTINEDFPDSNFFVWRGQGQYLRELAPDTLFLFRTDLQIAGRPLVPLEQFTLGGPESVRGYRQDLIVSDSGFFASGEIRIPIARIPQWQGLLQVTPFVDVGTSWNVSEKNFDPSTLVSTGLGLYWQQGKYFNLRFMWGIPLVPTDTQKTNWQENGLYFSVYWRPF